MFSHIPRHLQYFYLRKQDGFETNRLGTQVSQSINSQFKPLKYTVAGSGNPHQLESSLMKMVDNYSSYFVIRLTKVFLPMKGVL